MKKIFFLIIFLIAAEENFCQMEENFPPILFDDFSYSSVEFPISGDSSNSLFGRNIWITNEGKISSRAWRRYNWGDPDNFGERSILEPTSEGIRLGVAKGFEIGKIAPMFGSGFLLKEGVYAARIKFGRLPKDKKMIQAFWFSSPDYYTFIEEKNKTTYFSEMDFEWNNWFRKRGENIMSVGTISAKKPELVNTGGVLNCVYRSDGKKLFSENCEGKIDGEEIIPGRWFICKMMVDSSTKKISFAMMSDDEKKIFAGEVKDKVLSNAEFVLDKYYPKYEISTIFNIGPDRWKADVPEQIDEDCAMEIDWFFYSPATALVFIEIKNEIEKIREKKIPRINTTGNELFAGVPPNDAHFVEIQGPEALDAGRAGHWQIAPTKKGTTYEIMARFRYYSDGIPNEWIPVYTTDFTINTNEMNSAVEIETTVNNFWNGHSVSARKFIPVK